MQNQLTSTLPRYWCHNGAPPGCAFWRGLQQWSCTWWQGYGGRGQGEGIGQVTKIRLWRHFSTYSFWGRVFSTDVERCLQPSAWRSIRALSQPPSASLFSSRCSWCLHQRVVLCWGFYQTWQWGAPCIDGSKSDQQQNFGRLWLPICLIQSCPLNMRSWDGWTIWSPISSTNCGGSLKRLVVPFKDMQHIEKKGQSGKMGQWKVSEHISICPKVFIAKKGIGACIFSSSSFCFMHFLLFKGHGEPHFLKSRVTHSMPCQMSGSLWLIGTMAIPFCLKESNINKLIDKVKSDYQSDPKANYKRPRAPCDHKVPHLLEGPFIQFSPRFYHAK